MKVSKVVLIVVALHVVVIGGIFVFEGCSRSQAPAPDMAANESLPGEQPTGMTPAVQTVAPIAPMTQQGLTPATPVMTTAPVEAAAPAARTYVVRKGDSLWKISRNQGVGLGELTRANNLAKTSVLKIGQKLQIPQSARAEAVTTATASVIPASADAAAAAPIADASGPVYTVKSGDSLWKIARQQGVSVATLKQSNGLTSDSLKIGQKLHLPAAGASASVSSGISAGIATPSSDAAWREPGQYTENGQTIHIVDFNESPAIIAKKYGIKATDLMRANNITDPKRVNYGQKLVIPLAQPATSAAAIPAASTGSGDPTLAAPVVSASQATIQ